MTGELIHYGGVEVINTERLAAYLANGLRPEGFDFDVDVCEGLAEARTGPGFVAYRTPMQDQPGWYDVNNPDSFDFAGVLPLTLTGVLGTTRTVDVAAMVDGRGVAGRPQRGPQTFSATGVLVGRTSEAVQVGLSWLRNVLHRECAVPGSGCGATGELEFFTACPGPISVAPDLTTPLTRVEVHPNGVGGTPSHWYVDNGTSVDHLDGTLLSPYADGGDLIVAGDAGSDYPTVVTATAALTDPLIVGGAAFVYGRATVATLATQDCGMPGPLTMTWSAYTTRAGTSAQFVVIGADGNVAVAGPTVELSASLDSYTWELPEGYSDDGTWRIALVINGPVVVASATLDGYGALTTDECLAPYRRTVPGTVTVDGPHVVEVVPGDCAELLVVEWTWVATDPYRYGPAYPLALDVGRGSGPSYAAPGVTVDNPAWTGVATPWHCAAPSPSVSSCATDPFLGSLTAPPAPPAITDTTRPRITTQSVSGYEVMIGPEQVPTDDGVLRIILTAGAAPVVGARVRVYDTALADGTVPDLCDFAYEYLIDYIPSGGVLTIDGDGSISTLCAGDATPVDSSASVMGSYGGPAGSPELRCDRRYLVVVHWLAVYPRTAAPYYTSGDINGQLTLDLYAMQRSG